MQRFQKIQCIGTGAYSVVYKGIDKSTQQTVAIKEISHKNIDINQIFNRQVRILTKLNHPNIIKLIQCFGNANSTFLIFQYIPYDLITFYKKFYSQNQRNLNDKEISYIFYQITQALVYMHTLNFMHRDIKPENILINPQTLQIKIIDFGFATQNKLYGNTNYMVTRWYRSLQIVLNLPYDFRADVFALGAMMLQLYLGEQIFKSSSNIDQLFWICNICGVPTWQPALEKMKKLGITLAPNQPKLFKMTKNLRPQASNIIINMLQTTPITRITSFQLIRHPYFSKFHIEFTRIRRPQQNNESRRQSTNSKYNHQSHLNIPQIIHKKVQQKPLRLNHVNSQPFFHTRSLSQKDPFLRQVSLSRQKNQSKINFNNKKFPNKHLRTQTCEIKSNRFLQSRLQKNQKFIRNTMESEEKNISFDNQSLKKRTRSLNPGLNIISTHKNLKTNYIQKIQRNNYIQNQNVNHIKKTNQPPVFSKIKDKLIQTNRQNKNKNKISLSERPQFGQKKLRLLK